MVMSVNNFKNLTNVHGMYNGDALDGNNCQKLIMQEL